MGLTGSKKQKTEGKNATNCEERPAEVSRTNPLSTLKQPSLLMQKYAHLLRTEGIIPDFFLIHQTPSTKFIDEDGDEAHEFYEESVTDGQKTRLKRIVDNLKPKGVEKLEIPRLSPDVPVVMWEINATKP